MSVFSLNYSIDVDEENAIVRAKIYGLWKAETAEAYHRDFMEAFAPMMGRPWVKIVDLSNWKTSYDKVIDIIGRHMKWSKENKVQIQLYVLDNPSTFRQLNRMFEKGTTTDISLTFRSTAEAEKYLEEHWLNKKAQP